MNWEAIGAIGEIVGALAVVLTLYFLAKQVRASNRSAYAAAHSIRADRNIRMVQWVAEQGVEEIRLRMARGDDVTDGERYKVIYGDFALLRHLEDMHFQYLEGGIGEEVWTACQGGIANVISSPAFDENFSNARRILRPSFVEIVEAAAKKLNANPRSNS